VLTVLLLLVLATLADARRLGIAHAPSLAAQEELVHRLGLSDLALFTEARYTRHLSLADLHSPFQNHPLALEHFPSGSVVAPPAHLTGILHEALDREAALSR
jgi:hypothetical protein